MSMFRRRLLIMNALKNGGNEHEQIDYPNLIAAWSAKGKTNADNNKDILKDLTGNGHDITLNGFEDEWVNGKGYDNPDYPDALVFDGVNDYGINKNMPILDDFTLITKIDSLNTYTTRGIITKDDGDYTKGIFSIRQGSVLVKGESNAINFTNGITYLNLNTYNGNSINVGTGEDVSTINIGCIRPGNYYSAMIFYSAYLFDRSLDEQEIKSFIREYIDAEYLLPNEQ